MSGPGTAAFTLIELILVMALLMTILGVTFPSLKNFFRGRQLDSEARRFLSLTHYAQNRSVSEGIPMVLWIDTRERTYGLQAHTTYLETDDKAVAYQLDDDIAMEISPPPAGTVLLNRARSSSTSLSANQPEVRFLPEGFIDPSSPETIVLREGEDRQLWIHQNANRMHYEIHAVQPTPTTR